MPAALSFTAKSRRRPNFKSGIYRLLGTSHFFNRTPHTEDNVVKTYPLDFLFHLDPTDLPMEEHISTRGPSDFQEIQSDLQDIYSAPWIFTSMLHLIS